MSKKMGKIIAGLTAFAAIGAGAFYYFKKKQNAELENEFEDDELDKDFELDEDLEEVPAEREYVPLTPSEEPKVEECCSEEACTCEEVKEECCCEEACACEEEITEA